MSSTFITRACVLSLAMLTAFSVVQAQTSNPALQPKAVQLDNAALNAVVGQYAYDDEPDIVLSISRDGSHLYAEAERSPRTELLAESPGHFFMADSDVRYVFAPGPQTGTPISSKSSEKPGSNGAGSAGKMITMVRMQGEDTRHATRVGDQPVRNHFRPYDRKEVMIPMRDGVKLHAVILRPRDTDKPLPFLMQRTPYGVAGSTSDEINACCTWLAQSGYIFVMADIRGRYGSEGKFVMNQPIVHKEGDRTDPKLVDESTDTYDTVAWLLKNVTNNNGRVGVVGVSYPGFLAMMAGIDPHPAVKAISPQAPMTDIWMGDDFFHNGAFRQTYGYDYVLGMESGKENAFGKLDKDAYDFFLQAGSFAKAARKGGVAKLPTGKAFLQHPTYDNFWQDMAVERHLTRVTVPTLEVGGWWDQEDMWGTQAEYAALKPHDSNHEVFLALGPWNHGEWGRTTRHLGVLDFGAATGDQFNKQIEAPFFAHYLKDESGFDLKDTASFQTGSNKWMRYDAWPPKQGFQNKNLYLAGDGSLTFAQPPAGDASTAYISDPKQPVAYRARPVQATYAPGSQWYTWLVQDQRPLTAGRKDVASWSTPALDHDVTVTGDVVADIFASTSGSDADWVVKLIDVYPDAELKVDAAKDQARKEDARNDDAAANDAATKSMTGYELMIVDEIFRGRYRASFEHPTAIKPNEVDEYKWSLHGADHVFLKGHRIMVQVQSSWFPLYDRNPQTYVDSIMTARKRSYKTATEKIYESAQYPSHIELPVAVQ